MEDLRYMNTSLPPSKMAQDGSERAGIRKAENVRLSYRIGVFFVYIFMQNYAETLNLYDYVKKNSLPERDGIYINDVAHWGPSKRNSSMKGEKMQLFVK